MRKIKVLYIIDSLFVGGAEKFLVNLVNAIDPDKFEVWVCCLWSSGPLEKDLNLPLDRIITLNFGGYKDYKAYIKLCKFIAQQRFDVVHTQIFPSNTVGRICAFFMRVPVIIATEQNIYQWKLRKHVFVDRILAYISDRIMAVSEEVKKFTISQEKIPEEKFIVIPNAIPVDRYDSGRLKIDIKKKKNDLSLPDNSLVIGTVATLINQKGHKYLLEVAKILAEKIPDIHFLLIGEGPLRRELEQFTKQLKIDSKVHFLGVCGDVDELLGIIDVFVLPSLYEGLPLALLEALAMRKAVVATKVGGIPEVVEHGKNGILVEPRDPEGLAEGIVKLIRNPNLAAKMGEEGRKIVEEKFSTNVVVRKLENLYEELLYQYP